MSWTLERIDKKLREINSSIPETLRKHVIKEVKKSPVVEMVIQKAIEDPSIPEAKRTALKNLYENGDFSKTVIREDPRIAKQIDNYVNRKIREAIKNGELPSKSKLKELLKQRNEQVRNK